MNDYLNYDFDLEDLYDDDPYFDEEAYDDLDLYYDDEYDLDLNFEDESYDGDFAEGRRRGKGRKKKNKREREERKRKERERQAQMQRMIRDQKRKIREKERKINSLSAAQNNIQVVRPQAVKTGIPPAGYPLPNIPSQQVVSASSNVPVYAVPIIQEKAPTEVKVKQAFSRANLEIMRARKAIGAVKSESRYMADEVTEILNKHEKRISGTENSQAASKVLDEITANYPELISNPVFKTALPLLPLLFIKPEKKGDGIESFIRDPRVWPTLLAAGAAILKNNQDNSQ